MNKVAVTGSKGFLGRYLVKALRERGYQVLELVRKPAGTETSLELGLMDGCDRLYHLAAHYDPKPDFGDPADKLVESNVTYAALVADYAAWAGVREVVYCTTPRQFGPAGKPVGLYGATKAAGLMIFESYHQFRTHPVLIGDTFGPGDTRGKIVQKIVQAAARGEPLIEVPYGKCINPISVQYVAEQLATRDALPTNLCGRPTELVDIQGEIRGAGGFVCIRKNLDSSDPFPYGYRNYNEHYRTLREDLRAYFKAVELVT